MTSRRPFQRLIAALAIASGSAAYGATAQPSPLQPVDSFQSSGLTRNAILAGDPSGGAPILLAADRGGKGGGGGGGGRSSGGGGSSRSSGGGGGSVRSSGGGGGSVRSSSGGGSSGPRISSGGSSRSSGGSTPRISGGSTVSQRGGDSGRSSGPRVSGGDSGRSSAPRIQGDAGGRSSGRVETPRIQTPRVEAPRTPTPRVETPRVQTPRVDTPRIQTPRGDNTPRVDSNRIQIPRVDTPRVDTPRVQTPRIDPPRVENRNNVGGSTNIGGNRIDSNTRNNNAIDSNRRGNTGIDTGNRVDSNVRTPRSNTLPNLGGRDDNNRGGNAADRLNNNANRLENRGTPGGDNASNRLRDNADRVTDRLNNRTTEPGSNAADRLRDNADRIGNRDRNNDDATRNATDRLRDNADRIGNRDGNPLNNADRVNRDNLDPKLRNALDRARDNRNTATDRTRENRDNITDRARDARDNVTDRTRDNADRVRDNTRDAADRIRDNARDNADRVRDRADNVARDANRRGDDARDNIRDGVRPVVVRPDRVNNPDIRNRIDREKIVIRDNDRTINLTPINRPGIGRSFGRDNLVDRRVALNGLLHQSYANRNVRYNGRFNDWQAWNGRSYWRHNNWHRGYWNYNRWNGFYGPNWWGFGIGFGRGWGGGWGRYGGWGGGWGGWGGGYGYPVAMSFGLSPWGMNYMGYGFGLYDYYNPYCYQPVPFYGGYTYDYTQPLIVNNYGYSDPGVVVGSGVVAQNAVPPQQTEQEPDMALFDQARTAFANGNYDQALQLTEQQIQKTPKDSILHEFRGLVLFALGRFEDAAIPVYAVLAVGPGWDWSTMSSLYSNVDAYASQLKALEDFHRANPDNAAASFLLAYQYLTCGHNEAAAAQLDNVLRINPQDLVATRLLQALGDGTTRSAEEMPAQQDDKTAEAPLQVPTIPDLPAPVPVKAEDLYGTWTATNAKGRTFTLKLTQDGTFEWISKDDQKTIDQKGVFGVEGETLAMEPDGGGVLVGKVSKPENGSFKLELAGGLPDDAALEFKVVK